jgi:outer membrane protein OmpA-like peptidoglycan-associated protein
MKTRKNRLGVSLFLIIGGIGLVVTGQAMWTRALISESKTAEAPQEQEDDKEDVAPAPTDGSADDQSQAKPEPEATGEKARGSKEPKEDVEARGRDADGRSAIKVESLRPKKIVLVMRRRSSRVTSSHRRRLRQLVAGRSDETWKYQVVGFASERSTKRKNVRLAARRARHVARYIRRAGAKEAQIRIRYLTGPNPGLEPAEWRKVEVTVKREKREK